MTLRVVELFAGIGAQAQALENLGLDFASTVCEIDEKAYKSYCAIHGDTPNLGDITKVDHLPECDLLTYSFPCQDLSIAGCQRGMKQGSGTRSSLLWEVGRLLDDAKEREREPEVLLMENVDAILNRKNISEFERWIEFLTDLGYTSSYKVLNAKDFGVPQNRKRCFMVSSLGGRKFIFPEGFQLGRRLRDVLEDGVPEEYYLSEEKIAKYEKHKARHEAEGHGFGWRPNHGENIAYTVNTKLDRANQNFVIESPICVGNIQCEGFNEMTSRVYDAGGLSPTIRTPSGGGVMPKIEVLGTLGDYEKEGRVHNPNGLSPTLNLCRPDHALKIEVIGHIEGYQGQSGRVHDTEGQAPTVVANRFGSPASLIEVQDSIRYPCATAKGYMEAHEGDGLVMNRTLTARGTVQEASAPTLTTGNGCGTGTVDKGLRIRYLTPRECWRLMGFPDSAFEAARDVPTSKTQLYKQAGNSIAVPCLEAIFRSIYIDRTWHCRPSLEVWM